MDLHLVTPVLEAIVFGIVVAVVEVLIARGIPAHPWLARAWVYACFCYIILFGLIKV